jgi:hypothetical protein
MKPVLPLEALQCSHLQFLATSVSRNLQWGVAAMNVSFSLLTMGQRSLSI